MLRMSNVDYTRSPKELERCDVWPKERAHLLEEGYDYEFVTAIIKASITVSEALLRFHYPTLYNDPRVLFCDTGTHICVYIAIPIDTMQIEA